MQFINKWNANKLLHSKNPDAAAAKADAAAFKKLKGRYLSVGVGQVWVWSLAAMLVVIAVLFSYVNVADPLPDQFLSIEACMVQMRYLVLAVAISNTLLLIIFSATYFRVADAFFFKAELLAVAFILPGTFTGWGLSIFGYTTLALPTQSNIFIYIQSFLSLLFSIYFPLYLSVRQNRSVHRLRTQGISIGDAPLLEESLDTPSALAIIIDAKPWNSNGDQESPLSGGTTAVQRGLLSPGDASGGSMELMVPGDSSNVDAPARDQRRPAWSAARRKKTEIPVKTSNVRLFSIALVNDVLRAAFQRYCMQSWSIENYLFYRDGTRTRRAPGIMNGIGLGQGTGKSLMRGSVALLGCSFSAAVKFRTMHTAHLAAEAERISNTYLQLDETLTVNLPEDIRARIASRFSEKDVTNDLYQEAEDAVLEFMRNDTFLKWRTTDAFAEAWRRADVPPAMLDVRKPVSTLSEDNVSRLLVELGSTSQATGRSGAVSVPAH